MSSFFPPLNLPGPQESPDLLHVAAVEEGAQGELEPPVKCDHPSALKVHGVEHQGRHVVQVGEGGLGTGHQYSPRQCPHTRTANAGPDVALQVFHSFF